MRDRYYKLILFNAGMSLAMGAILAFSIRSGNWGAFLGMLFFVVLGASLAVVSVNFKEPPITLTDIRKMMRGFYERMLS